MYIKLTTLEYPRHIGDIEIDPAGPADYAVVENSDPPSYDMLRERITRSEPFQENGVWRVQWFITPIPKNEQMDMVRGIRNEKLAKSDWTQLPDSPVDKAAWGTYRQALRDIPEQQDFPWVVQWPIEP